MPQLDQDYLFLPYRLLADLQANSAAIGVYALLARLFLIYQEPIPLSAADLQRYDPTLSYGAARGALQRLVALRWLTAQSGHKNRYTPTWGVIKGSTRPWQLDAPTLGRPAHVVTLRLDRRLLDIGLGRLAPHPTYPAQTSERYLEQPILSLRDVGVYAQALTGRVIGAPPALLRYGLIQDGQAQPLPSTEALIALASQRTLAGDGASPSAHGRRKLGLAPSAAPPATLPGQPLFFVARDLIPDPISGSIPDLIPSGRDDPGPSRAAERARTREAVPAPPMPGTPGILSESSDPPPSPPARQHGGCGSDSSASETCRQRATLPQTESAQLLLSIQTFPRCVEELAGMPTALVRQAIAYAQAEPGIESVPGWVVAALRRHRDQSWPIPTPRNPDGAPSRDGWIDVAAYLHGADGARFRLGRDTTGLGVADLAPAEAAPGPPDLGAPMPTSETHAVLHNAPMNGADRSVIGDRRSAVCTGEDLTRQFQAELIARCGHRYRRVVEGLHVHVAGGTTRLVCATLDDMRLVQRELSGAIQPILAGLGAPPRLVFTTLAAWEARDAGHAWSQPAGANGQSVGPAIQ
jgi:hypothetical protein